MSFSRTMRRDTPRTNQYLTCAIQPDCRNCRYVNSDYQESLKDKFKESLIPFEGLDSVKESRVKLHAAPKPLEYRTTVKLVVKQLRSGIQIGLYQPGSHKVIDISDCPLHFPGINSLLRKLKALLPDSGLSIWDPEKRQGELRYVVLRAARMSQQLMITFVVHSEQSRPLVKKLSDGLRRDDPRIKTVYMNVNPTEGNEIWGEKFIPLTRRETIDERVGNFAIKLSPQTFFQVNPFVAEELYRRVIGLIGTTRSAKIAWDLYSGFAPYGLHLAKNGYRVLAVEENPQAAKDAQIIMSQHGINSQRLEFMPYRVENVAMPSWAKVPDVVVANPSRKGLSESVIDLFAQTKPNLSRFFKFYYISCNQQTLLRDIEKLTAVGFELQQLEAFDMFAQTTDFEWMAVLGVK